ncbi:MAG TPA: hypothetical protein VGN14_18110, partial [Candidatus Elarobacter sp.]
MATMRTVPVLAGCLLVSAFVSAAAAGAQPVAVSPAVEVRIAPDAGAPSTVIVRDVQLPRASAVVKVTVRLPQDDADTLLSTMYLTGTNRAGTVRRTVRGLLEAPLSAVRALSTESAPIA